MERGMSTSTTTSGASTADDAHAKAHVHDHFQRLHPDTNWRSCLEHGEKIGIGSREYELIKI